MESFIIITAFCLDCLLGDPRWFPHPVRGIGWLIQRGERLLRRIARTPRGEKIAGIFLVVLVVPIVGILSYFLIQASFTVSRSAGLVVSVVLAYTTFAARDLAHAASQVRKGLEQNDLLGARRELSAIVGRDTENLDEQEVIRAAVETVAENTADGMIAPLFYLAIGGPVLAMIYKAVNTLDSMVGYKNDRYRYFGWAAARIDDIANYLPARITALLIVAVAWSSSGSGLRAWRVILRDGRNHPSPNSGYPEAAVAGALGIRLGGPSTYGGLPSNKPFIGDATMLLNKKHIEMSARLMYSASLLGVAAAACARFFW